MEITVDEFPTKTKTSYRGGFGRRVWMDTDWKMFIRWSAGWRQEILSECSENVMNLVLKLSSVDKHFFNDRSPYVKGEAISSQMSMAADRFVFFYQFCLSVKQAKPAFYWIKVIWDSISGCLKFEDRDVI